MKFNGVSQTDILKSGIAVGQKRTGDFVLNRIKNTRIKNLVRGILSSKDLRSLEVTFSNLRKETPLSDVYAVYQFLESPLAKGFEKIVPFPTQPNRTNAVTLLPPASVAHELTAQRVRIENNLPRLMDAVEDLDQLNRAFFSDDDKLIASSVRSITERYGYSLFFLKKFLSIKYIKTDSADLNSSIQSYVSAYSSARRDISAIAIEDSIDPAKNYTNVRRTILEFVRNGKFDDVSSTLLQDHFRPIITGPEELSRRLQAYGLISIIDVCFFILSRNEDINNAMTDAERSYLLDAIPTGLRVRWRQLMADFNEGPFLRNDEKDEQKFLELKFLRHTNSWIEYTGVEKYRRFIEQKIGHRFDGISRIQQAATAGSIINEQPYTLEGILSGDCASPLCIDSFNPEQGGCLHRTIALMSIIEDEKIRFDRSGESLLLLLDKTIDVAYLASPEELSSFLSGSENDILFQYLKYALIHDGTENSVSGHRLRKSLESLVINRFNRDILQCAEYLYVNGSHVGNHFFGTCTESFLVQLYKLFPNSNDVVEARAGLLEWYGGKIRASHLIDRAKSLRLDIKLRKVRGDIDDNRIYVDSLRFVQWLSDELGPDLRASIPIIQDWPNQEVSAIELGNTIALLQNPELQLSHIFNRAYHEFCTNKFYGVDSYIGRRIRHGTLRGTMVPEARNLVNEFEAQFSQTEPSACILLDAWINQFESIVKILGLESLQIRSDSKPRGLIVANVNGTHKYSTAKLAVDAIKNALTSENAVPNAVAVILEYCWIVLEVDLKKIRADLQRVRDHQLLMDPMDFISRCDCQNTRALSDICRNINDSVNRKFSTLSLWLTRPNNISPSTTLGLLFKAVLIEVKEQIPDYNPILFEDGAFDIDLYGHRYHYVYDILYIIVYNAAKHGDRSGPLTIKETLDQRGNTLVVDISISSELRAGDSLEEVKAKIDQAMNADIENALIVEGFSGIKKVRALSSQLEEISAFSVKYGDSSVTFDFKLIFPST